MTGPPAPQTARASRAATFAAIQSLLRQGDCQGAEARLREVLQWPDMLPANRGLALRLLGDALDGLARPADAFAAYAAANAELGRAQPPAAAPGETALQLARRLGDYVQDPPAAWRAPAQPGGTPPDAARTHVFLVGFPRSGTTLLEYALAGHPRIASLEEQKTLTEREDSYLASPQALARLAALDPDEAARLREAYWLRVRALAGADLGSEVFIDKMPLNTVRLPVIARLFPQARILFALRDPRDVVFSCFRRSFVLNASMREFLTLQGAADYYAAVMRLGETCLDVLAPPAHRIRYEDLVADFEGALTGALAFMGLDWSPEVADFPRRARERPGLTPSAAQLARGLYAGGIGQWRRYRAEMAPALPTLRPWVERYGYEPDDAAD